MNKATNNTNKSQQIVTLLLAIVSIFALCASLFIYQASKPKVYEYGIYKTGTPISAGLATVTINSINYDQGSSVFKAPAGKHYIVLDTTFKNNSDKSISIFPSTQTYLKDNSGHVYYLSPSTLEDPFKAGELLPNDIITGQLSYLVPVGSNYTFYIDSIWSGGVVSARLN